MCVNVSLCVYMCEYVRVCARACVCVTQKRVIKLRNVLNADVMNVILTVRAGSQSRVTSNDDLLSNLISPF